MRQNFFVLFILIIVLNSMAWAADELLVRETVQVYEAADRGSPIIGSLERGDRVPISSADYGRFRKVLFEKSGKKRPGYVLKSAIESSRIREKKGTERDANSGIYHRRTSAGVHLVLSNSSQGARKISTTDGGSIEISSLSGTAIWFGLHLDLPMNPHWMLRGDLEFRKSSESGKAKPTGVSVAEKEIEKGVTFIGVAATAKYYFSAEGDFWLGGGLELAKATDVKLVYATNDTIPVPESDYPTFLVVRAGIGQDFSLFGDFSLIPELRGLFVVNSSPSIFGGELVLNTSYSF